MAVPEIVSELAVAARELAALGLVRGSGGNVSRRVGDTLTISRSGATLGHAAREDFVAVHLSTGQPVGAGLRPSSELAMHLAAYRACPSATVVFHIHPPYAIALGLLGRDLPAITPDGYLHLGESVPLIPYITPTTQELATAVEQYIAGRAAVLLQNHGALVVAPSLSEAAVRAQLLEESCQIWLTALTAGQPRSLTVSDRRGLDAITGGRYRFSR